MTSDPAARPALLHLAVALDGAGWHPAASPEPDAQPQRLSTADRRWATLPDVGARLAVNRPGGLVADLPRSRQP